jgi:hypothetical protein
VREGVSEGGVSGDQQAKRIEEGAKEINEKCGEA